MTKFAKKNTMKLLLFLFVISFIMSCTENDKKLDRETNTYYAKYKFIYESYDSLGIDASINLLEEYIQEFPNASDAYKFKAFLHSKKNDFVNVEKTIKSGLENTNDELSINNYYVSLLLQDTINIQKARNINLGIKADGVYNLETLYNNFWISTYSKEYETSDSLVTNILELDSTNNKKYLRTSFILAAVKSDTLELSLLKEKNQDVHINLIDSLILKKISLQEYYQLLSK